MIKDGIFYHFHARYDGLNRCKHWLRYNNFKKLKKVEKDYDKKLTQFNKFYRSSFSNPETQIKTLHQYFIDFTNIVFIGLELPEYFGQKIPKELFKFCFLIRKKYEDVHKRCFSLETKILKKIERKYRLKKYLSDLTIAEFNTFLKTKKIPKDMAGRKKFFLLKYSINGEQKYFDKALWDFFETKVGTVNLINGQSAYQGFFKGRIRIVRNISDIKKLKPDEVLTTSMTDPRYISAMKKASAIITDEGGITCHAAIVSRELKKPCIVGTKIATKVFKNGDLVEVDADHGTVRKIK